MEHLQKEMLHFERLLIHVSPSPQYGSPPSRFHSRSLHKRERDAPLPKPSLTRFSESPESQHPSRFPLTEPHRERCSVSTALFYSSLKDPGEGAPLLVPQRGPHGDGCPFPVSSRIQYLSESPLKEPSCDTWGKEYGHNPRSPTPTEGLHTRGCVLVPQGDHL
jgi:hypothetical protein